MYGVKMSYTDVHTANPQWEYNDFDARVPGAGTMAATFYAYGQLLLNDQRRMARRNRKEPTSGCTRAWSRAATAGSTPT